MAKKPRGYDREDQPPDAPPKSDRAANKGSDPNSATDADVTPLETPHTPSGAASAGTSAAGTTGAGTPGSTSTTPTQATTTSAPAEANNEVLVANVGDQPTPDDTLGFTPYVEAIASFLTNDVTKGPLTLSIEGEWGSGKSSFMLQLQQKLRDPDGAKRKVVPFNAWRYDKDDAMWAAFALEFTRGLSHELSWRDRWLAHLKLFLRRFNWQQGWMDIARLLIMAMALLVILLLPVLGRNRIIDFVNLLAGGSKGLDTALRGLVGVGGVIGYLAVVSLLIFKVKDIIGSPLTINLKQHLETPDYKSRVAFIQRFHEDFANVVEVYGKDEKVFVFIDDLDRCEVPKAADLMQALNLMISDRSQLIFIMGMDREKVAAGLAVKYEKLLPYLAPAPATNSARPVSPFDPVLGLEYGYSFIEKFIQLPFVVPQASEQKVEEFFKKLLGTAASKSPTQDAATPHQAVAAGESAEKAVTENTEMVTEILKMVAPTFDYNPRRLKQFINAFRLKTFIASRTGLFGEPADPNKYNTLTTQQLGKFVAVCLRWPLLLADLDNERDLLSRLQKLALASTAPEDLDGKMTKHVRTKALPAGPEGAEEVTITAALIRWYRRDRLRELLKAKLFSTNGNWLEGDERRIYSLERIDVNKLLQVSPITKPVIKESAKASTAPT